MKIEITKAQLNAIIDAADNLSAMVGAMDEDFNNDTKKIVRLIDRFLKRNGYKRKFN